MRRGRLTSSSKRSEIKDAELSREEKEVQLAGAGEVLIGGAREGEGSWSVGARSAVPGL